MKQKLLKAALHGLWAVAMPGILVGNGISLLLEKIFPDRLWTKPIVHATTLAWLITLGICLAVWIL